VIGGGIAGLLTALRLAQGGHAVALIEADRLGSGATTSNHGMVHSGALYVRQHGHVVQHLRQAHAAFSALVPDAELPADQAIYIVPTPDAPDFLDRLRRHRIAYGVTDPGQVPEVHFAVRDAHRLVTIGERVFSSRRIIAVLAGQCLAAAVTVITGASVVSVAHTGGKVTGVRLSHDHLPAHHVVIAAGTGTTQLLSDLGSPQARLLRSRLDMMIHMPAARLQRGLIFAASDRPVIMPALGGGALVSFFGGMQPEITGRRAFSVDLRKATALLDETLRALTPGSATGDGAVAYVAGKTDYVGTAHAEKGMINPGYHVIDHQRAEGLHGLYTVITGKMTLGFHASKAVADLILGTDLPLVMLPATAPDAPARLLATEPWAPPAQL
jgi:glycine/D-amino acid oxidase-like deaminating enzyme